MFTTRDISVKIGIPAYSLGNDIVSTITEKAKNLVLKREINNIGLISEVESVKSISGGEILLDSGVSRFTVVLSAKLYNPKLDEKIKTKVKDVSLHGYHVDEPVETFVGTDEKPDVKEGDIVTIRITKIGFNKGRFVVIAKQVSKEKKKGK